MDLGLRDRVFVVTGGSRGLGLASARELVAEGARVVVCARDETVLAAAVDSLGSESAVGIPGDLADPMTPERVIAAAVARFGRLDGAVVSVGGPPAGAPMEVDDETWRSSFESVFLGSLRVARATASAMTADPDGLSGTGGSIVLVLSTSVREPVAGLAVSNALRPALAGLVKDLSDELGARGIRVNAVLPGRLATDRVFALDARLGAPDLVRRRNETTIPLGRYGEPDELGRAVAFLASPAASYITGSALPLDGGLLRSF